MRIAYVRVSTQDQNEQRQVEQLEKCNIEKWYMEKISGKNMEREQLKSMLDFVRDRDEVYITDFSRISRSVMDLMKIVEMLGEKNVRLVSLKESLDTHTPQGRMMLTIIGAINEFERDVLLERQREGVAIAKREGKYHGRRRIELDETIFKEIVQEWQNGNITAVRASKILGISRGTWYNLIKRGNLVTDAGEDKNDQ